MSQQSLPFMTYVAGHVQIHSADGAEVMPRHWTGLCVDGLVPESHWYIGFEGSERSYTALQARDRASADAEVVARGLGVMSEQARAYIAEALDSVDMVLSVLEDARTNLPRAQDETLQNYVERALCKDFYRGDDCLFPVLYRRVTALSAPGMEFAEWEAAVCRALEERHDLSTSDAQGVLDGRAKDVQIAWRERCDVDAAADRLATASPVRESPAMEPAEGHAQRIAFPADVAFGPVLDWMVRQCRWPYSVPAVRLRSGEWEARDGEFVSRAPTEELAQRRCVVLRQVGSVAMVPLAVVVEGAAPVIASHFAQLVNEHYLSLPDGDELYQCMLQANLGEADPGVCHTHDHCDANVYMAQAVEMVLRRDPAEDDLMNDAAMIALWNASWDLARKTYLADIPAAVRTIEHAARDCVSLGLATPAVVDPEQEHLAKCLAVHDKWKSVAVLHHIDFDEDDDPVPFYDRAVEASFKGDVAVKAVFREFETRHKDRYENVRYAELVRYIGNMATMLQENERPSDLTPLGQAIAALRNGTGSLQAVCDAFDIAAGQDISAWDVDENGVHHSQGNGESIRPRGG